MKNQFAIEKARPEDRSHILKIMKFWNMHHVPSCEMEALDIDCFFVARAEGKVVGASGYRILSEEEGKTTLLGVDPEYCRSGIGLALQNARLEAMYEQGIKTVVTNADRPETIKWYQKHFGYRQIGRIRKKMSFGHPDIQEWTTLKMNLTQYMQNRKT